MKESSDKGTKGGCCGVMADGNDDQGSLLSLDEIKIKINKISPFLSPLFHLLPPTEAPAVGGKIKWVARGVVSIYIYLYI